MWLRGRAVWTNRRLEVRGGTMGRPRSAFTLVEILIVVMLLGILAAIVTPNI